MRPDLPAPDEELMALSQRLQDLIAAELDDAGSLPFSRYMELCLYAPGLGYYSAGLRKFGRDGDFVTAPELGPLFAGCIARAIAPVLRQLAVPTILELGPGSGRMAVDLLRALRDLDALPQRYWLLERSADLRERQIERLEQELPELLPRLAWLEQPPAERWDGVLLGNEVIDALPADLFRIDEGGQAQALVVVRNESGFGWQQQALPAAAAATLRARLQALPHALPEGWRGDWQPLLGDWLRTVGERLRDGLVLLADYGESRADLYHPWRTEGSLRCFYRHRVHGDPFWWPGLNDISVAVDFTAVAEAAADLGWTALGYDHQSAFLRAAGIEAVVGDLARLPERQRLQRANELRQLMLPSEMGERFKLISFCHGLKADDLPDPWRDQGQLERL